MPNLGPKLAEGSQHIVYEDPTDPSCLIKVPKVGSRFSLELVSQDIGLMDKHFAKWRLATDAIHERDSYYIRQERVASPEHLQPTHLELPGIRSIFEEIAEANRKARRDDGVEFDFMGTSGTFRAVREAVNGSKELALLNVLLSTRENVRLCGLLFHMNNLSMIERVNSRGSSALHRFFIKRQFGVDIGE